MRIVHFAQFGPRSCGLYETAKDLILAERALGVDARLVDIDNEQRSRVGLRDGQINTVHPDIAWDADILVRHSAIPAKYQNIGKPIIMCLHGRPDSSYRLSAAGINDVIQALANKAVDARYKAFVSFWPEHETAWRSLVGNKLHIIPAPVDLDYYAEGRDLNLMGTHRILIADIWRDDVIPLNSIFGAVRYIQKYEQQAKIHIVGMPTEGKRYEAIKPILKGISDYLGSVSGQMKGIRDWYRSCDCLVTPHTIATRIIREAMTAGLPVIAGAGCKYTEFTANPNNPDDIAESIKKVFSDIKASKKSRLTAEFNFDSTKSAKAMIELCEYITPKRIPKRKVFLDIGAHIGETVRRFYRQRPDADEFDIYCFEPDPEIFKILFKNVGAIENVHCICSALTTKNESRELTKGHVNQGDGSTLMKGKLTGDLKGTIRVICQDINEWIEQKLGKFDYLIVKMNIEGAEYELLPHMVVSGLMSKVDELYVWLHSFKFDTAKRIKMDEIELQWRRNMKKYHTKVFARTKGKDSFGNSANTQRQAS